MTRNTLSIRLAVAAFVAAASLSATAALAGSHEVETFSIDGSDDPMSAEERHGLTLTPGAGLPGGAFPGDRFFGDDVAGRFSPGAPQLSVVGPCEIRVGGFGDVDMASDLSSMRGGGTMILAGLSGDSGDDRRDRSQWGSDEHKKWLAKRKKELEKEIEDRRAKHLKSKAGKATKKKLDEIEKARQKRMAELEKERRKRMCEMSTNCCGRGEQIKLIDWHLEEIEKIDDDIDKKKKQAIDDDIKKAGEKEGKKQQDAVDELNDINDTQDDIRQAEAQSALS